MYVICDKENHASIYDGCKLSYGKMLRFDHADMEDLERQLQKVPQKAGCLIVTDGVFSMAGDIAKLPEIVRAGTSSTAPGSWWTTPTALGVLGEGGRGTASYFGLEDEVDLYHGHVLQIPGAAWAATLRASDADHRLYPPRFPAVYLLGVHPACLCGVRPGGAAASEGASGAGAAAAGPF